MSSFEPSSTDPLARCAEKQSLLSSGAEEWAQDAIRSGFEAFGPGGASLKSFLHGDWLHEPLHSVLTDIPIGAWTVTFVCDLADTVADTPKLKNAADVSLTIGLIGAAGAAIAGLTDWSEIKGPKTRKVATTHAFLNIGATGLFIASSVARRGGKSRTAARLLAAAGYLAASVSAHLGGNLVYEHGVGVRRASADRRLHVAEDAVIADSEEKPRDPEDRPAPADDEEALREKNLDKTIADSFPTSDPPSSIPNPS
jgi:uncharacterized membrane protein